MAWPANSPDLSPLETVWGYMKKKLEQNPNKPKNIEKLWEQVQDIWTSIPIEFLQELYNTIPNRVKAVYKAKGGITRY